MLGRSADCLSSVRILLTSNVGQECWLLKQCQNLPPGNFGAGVLAVKAVSEPTSRELWGWSAGCLSSVRTYLTSTVGQECWLLKQCQNLPPGNFGAGVLAVKAVSEPTSRELWGWSAGCLSSVRTYLTSIVGQECWLLKQCQNLPPGNFGAGVLAVKAVSEPTSRELSGWSAGCLSGVRTYLTSTVGQECWLLKQCQNILPGNFGAGVLAVKAVSEPTSPALLGRSACCLSGVGTYLTSTVGQECWLFKRCWNLPHRHCWAGVQIVYAVSEPTSLALLGSSAGCSSGVRTYVPKHCGAGVQAF